MDESWKIWPAQGHLCPVCSHPHFPFCSMPAPPPHAFDRYRPNVADFHRFPPSMVPSFPHNPPFWDHRPLPPPMPYAPDSWGLHRAPEREAFRPVIHPPPQRFRPDEVSGGESSYKRMRVDGPPMGTFHPPPSYDRPEVVPGTFCADDERRLNLIRDHGKQKDMERLPQSNGHLLQDKSARDVVRNQYNDVGADHGFDGPKFSSVGRGGPMLPQGLSFDPTNKLMIPKLSEAHQKLSGPLGSHGDERFVSHERSNFEGVRAYNSYLGDFDSAHCERKDHVGVTGVGDYPNGGYNHPDVSSQRLDSYSDGALPNFDSNVPQGGPNNYNSHNFIEVHPPTDSPYRLLQTQISEPGSHNLLQDGTGKNGYYPAFGDSRVLPETKFADGRFPPMLGTNNNGGMTNEMQVRMHTHGVYPSLSTPLPAGHLDPSLQHAPRPSPSLGVPPVALFPVLASASTMTPVPPNKTYPDTHALPQSSGCRERSPHPSSETSNQDLTFINQPPVKLDGVPKVPPDNSMKIKSTIVDARDLFKQPHCASRPNHIVIILRGLPGSGKSYLAKALRDLEIENGGNTPRIHAMDDYFMIEVEKTVDGSEGSKPSGSKAKIQTTKKVIEYSYELEMEEAYRLSMLKAFRKTLEEGIFTFVIVDDRNLRVADFAQFWAIAKRSGYEVYLLEAPYKDPTGCAARNVHGLTLEDIQKMTEKWEDAPPMYLQLDIQSLFRGDDMNDHSIQEVDMDITDSDCDDDSSKFQNKDKESFKNLEPKSAASVPDQVGERWESDEEEEEQTRVKELGNSKWSKDLDEDDEKPKGVRGNQNALSGLIQAYSKGRKSVHWGDQSDNSGFSIGFMKKKSSLTIGPGAGYNLTSNPLTEDQVAAEATQSSSVSESKRQFSEKLRAEHESIRAVLKKRQRRIGGFFSIEDD